MPQLRRISRASARALAALLLLRTAALSAQDGAAAPPAPASGDTALEAFLHTQTDALGRACELLAQASSGELRYLACGAAGLWTVRAQSGTWSLLGAQELGGRVTGFFSAEGRTWVKIHSERAQPLEPLVPGPLLAAPRTRAASLARTPPAAAADSWSGRVTGSADELVSIELSADVQLASGRHVAFSSERAAPDERTSVVGRVVSSAPGRARVALGTNESVPEAARATPTSLPDTASTIAPPRAAGLWEISFLARPFLVLDDLGVGALLDAQVGYRMQAPFHFEAALTPLALGTARAGAVVPFAALVSAAYDAQLFEAGLGVGAQSVNDPAFGLDHGSGTLVAQRLRLGARDGLHVELQSHVVLFHRSFQFSSLRGRAQLPLGARTWLHAAGGGGSMGVASGELGLRVLLAGNGGAGSFFLTTVVGWVSLYRGCNALARGTCETIRYAGPLLGVGAELRR